MGHPLSLLISGPLFVVLGAVTYLLAQELMLWRTRRDPAQAWVATWCFFAAAFVASRLAQRVGYQSDAVVRASVYLQFGLATVFLPVSSLAARALAGRPPSRRTVLAFGVGVAVVLVVLVAFGVGHELYDRVDLLGQPLRAARVRPGVLVLAPLVVATVVDGVRALRTAPASYAVDKLLIGLVLVLGALGLNDALLAAGVVRTLQLSHIGVVLVMMGGGYVQTLRVSIEQQRLDAAIAARTEDLERALEEVRGGEARFRMLTDATLEGIVVYDDAGKVLDANAALTRLFGSDALERAKGNLASLFAEESVGAVEALLAGTTRGPVQARGRREDGTLFALEASGTRGKVGVSGVGVLALHDTSERDEMSKRLVLADRMASLGTLAAGAAHEINNPLAYVSLNLEFAADMLRGGTLAPAAVVELRTLLDESRQGCERIGRIVRDLRTLSREEEGRVDEPVDVRSVVEAAVQMARHETRHRARLVENYSETPLVRASHARLSQVCLNLLINAAHAIPTGHADENEIRVTTRAENDSVIIEVTDTGSGIPPDVLPRVFDPFFTTKPVGIGTGLGLSICHTLVTAMGGQIAVDTEVGRGTTFRVTLPAARDAVAPASPVAQTPEADLPAARVLIVDDEAPLAKAIARGLKGCSTTVLHSGKQALALLELETFDVILCDVMMPETGGVEVLESLRRRRPELAERFVFMTGGVLSDKMKAIVASGTVRCLQKPIDLADVRRTVDEVLAARRGETAAAAATD